MLEVDMLTKHYPISVKKNAQKYKIALDQVSFSLQPGLYGLLGPNGAGKSTLINIITGNLRATHGNVFWNGKPAKGKSFRRQLGYMPQQQKLYDSFTGAQFLAYMAALKEIPKTEMKAEITRVAQLVNLSNDLGKRLSSYSGGMKQRLLAAAALLGDPKLLILDEPTAGLDPKERVRLREILADMSTERVIIVATHVVSDVEKVADEILLLKKGKLVDKAPPKQLVEAYTNNGGLEEVYLAVFGGEDS